MGTIERKRNTLLDKMDLAAERKEFELQKVKMKAKAENQKFEETNWLMKMTKEN